MNNLFNKFASHSITQRILLRILQGQVFFSMNSHSVPVAKHYKGMHVRVLPALSDNFMYLIVDEKTNEAAVIDPVDAEVVVRSLTEEKAKLKMILTTHHHIDHAGGNAKLLEKINVEIPVVGGDERIEAINTVVKDKEELKVGNMTITCFKTPCHTIGHICYYVCVENADAPLVFTGDTLFIAGCGRFFEGTPQMMQKSLYEKLAPLPDNTNVFCGHEYTVNNLKFASQVEPDNGDVKEALEKAIEKRQRREPTVPSTIGDEKKINPFMRVHLESVRKYSKETDDVKTMAYVRKMKDNFKA